MEAQSGNPIKKTLKQLFRWFLSGMIVLLPLAATLILVGWAIDFLDQLVGGRSIFARFWRSILGIFSLSAFTSVLLGYAFIFAFIILVGYFTQRYASHRISSWLRSFFDQIPVVNKIYRSIEQVIDLWSKKGEGEKMQKMGEVVIVDFANVKTFGILSSRKTYQMNGDAYYLVYLPSSPIPATGFTYFFRSGDVFVCDQLKMDEMTKVVVSLGVLGHEVLGNDIPLKKLLTDTRERP